MAEMQQYQAPEKEQLVAPLQSNPWRHCTQLAGAVAGLFLLAAVVAHGTSYKMYDTGK